MSTDGDDISICTLKNGKLSCNEFPRESGGGSIPALPMKLAWVLIIAALVMIVIAVVLNHLIFSMPGVTTFVFPFGDIEIDRDTLYDISLFLFVIAVVVVIIAFIFAARNRSRVIMLRE